MGNFVITILNHLFKGHLYMHFFKYIITFIFLLFIACGKVELPSDEKKKEDNSEQTDDDKTDAEVLTMKDVLSAKADDYVLAEGYIVGYIRGMSLKNAVFDAPEDGPNTNILLADSPYQQDKALVVPMRLKANSPYRESLNLYEYPQLLHQRLRVLAYTRKYFGVMGLYDIYRCILIEDDDHGGDPKPDPNPEDENEIDLPTIDPNTPHEPIIGR